MVDEDDGAETLRQNSRRRVGDTPTKGTANGVGEEEDQGADFMEEVVLATHTPT